MFGKVKSNAVPLVIGAAVGYLAVPFLLNLIKNR